jgi:CheY-like chemotaxis protein
MAHQHAEYLAAGMDALVAKPIELATLLKTIDAVISAPLAPARSSAGNA